MSPTDMQHDEKQPLVAVLTPFYNTEEYLAECIESVLAQSYGNWRYILLNNCSTDRSPQIAEEYARRDGRIELHHNDTFLGQVQNYNRALQLAPAQSAYCKIVQADDLIYPHCLEKMVALAESDPSIGLVSAYYLAGTRGPNKGPPGEGTVFRGADMARMHLLGLAFGFGNPTSVMYRAEIVRNRQPFYSERSLHEDTEVCYEILLSWNFGYVRDVLTFIRVGNESITSSTSTFNASLLDVFIRLKKYGLIFLDKREFRDRYREVSNEYRKYLGKSALKLRWDRAFWQYHGRGLETVGMDLGVGFLAKCLLLALYAGVRKPFRIFRRDRDPAAS